MKPRVMILVIFTAFVGMMLAPSNIYPITSFYILLSITLGAGSSAAINIDSSNSYTVVLEQNGVVNEVKVNGGSASTITIKQQN